MRNSILAAVRRISSAQPALDDSVRRVSFGDLNRLIEQERRWLHSFAVRDCALVAENSSGWVVSDLALLAMGATSVAIPTTFTAEQMGHALQDCGAEFVLTESRMRPSIEQSGFTKVGLSNRTGLTLMYRRSCLRRKLPKGVVKASYRAQGMSAPQVVMLSAVMVERATAQLLQSHGNRVIGKHLSFLPLTSVLENIGGLYVPLLCGAQVVLKTRTIAAMSCAPTGGETLLAVLSQERPHSVALTAELLSALVRAIDCGWQVPPELNSIVVDGEDLSRELLQRARAAGLPVTEWDPIEHSATRICGSVRSEATTRLVAVRSRAEGIAAN